MNRDPNAKGVRRTFRLNASKESIARSVEEEIEFHLASRTQLLMEQGVDAAEARAQAEREYGDVSASRHELVRVDAALHRRESRGASMDSVREDFRYGIRSYLREPGFTALAITTLAVGIAAAVAMFGIVDRLLLRYPAGISEPATLSRVYLSETEGSPAEEHITDILGYEHYDALTKFPNAFPGVAAYLSEEVPIGTGPTAHKLAMNSVTPGFFRMLGVRAAVGRTLDDAQDGNTPFMVVSHRYWRDRLHSDPRAIGSAIAIGPTTYTVIGITAPGFAGLDIKPADAWISLEQRGPQWMGPTWKKPFMARWLRLVVRENTAVPEIARIQAATSAHIAAARLPNEFRSTTKVDKHEQARLGSLIPGRSLTRASSQGSVAQTASVSVWLLGMAVLVLLVACANVANLLLARVLRRSSDYAVRNALGVSRYRLFQQQLVETIILAGAACIAGTVLAVIASRMATHILLPGVQVEEMLLSGRALAVSLATATVLIVVTGLWPALRALRTDVAETLKATTRGGGVGSARLRGGLLVVQAALVVIVLFAASAFQRSLANALAVPLGLDPSNVMLVSYEMETDSVSGLSRGELYERAETALESVPEVAAVSVASTAPFWGSMSGGPIYTTPDDSIGFSDTKNEYGGGPYMNSVGPGYFKALSTRIILGRVFNRSDVEGSAPVAVVSMSLARRLWPNENPMGKCFWARNRTKPCHTVVGVVDDTERLEIDTRPELQYYVPMSQRRFTRGANLLIVRTRDGNAASVRAVQRSMQSVVASAPYVDITPLSRRIEPFRQSWRLGSHVLGAFGLLTLMIAAVGLYGVINYNALARRREFGVRTALGATHGELASLMIRDAVMLVGFGLLIGLFAAVPLGALMRPLLYEAEPLNAVTIIGVVVIMTVTAVAAAAVPGIRNTRVHPLRMMQG